MNIDKMPIWLPTAFALFIFLGIVLIDDQVKEKEPKVFIESYEKDDVEYIIFIHKDGGVHVENHTREVLITRGLESQIIVE